MVLLVAAHVALPGRRQHGGPRGPRAHRAVALLAQPRAAQRAPLRRRPLRGAHAAPERAPRARAHRPAPPAAAAAARAGAVRRHRARHRHRHRQRLRRRQRHRRHAGAGLAQLAGAARAAAAQLGRQAAAGGHALQRGGLGDSRLASEIIHDFLDRCGRRDRGRSARGSDFGTDSDRIDEEMYYVGVYNFKRNGGCLLRRRRLLFYWQIF